jgi:hypothetical protein
MKDDELCPSRSILWRNEAAHQGLKRFTPQHSFDEHSGYAGEGGSTKRAAQEAAGASRLSAAARSTEKTLKKSALQQKRKDWHYSLLRFRNCDLL